MGTQPYRSLTADEISDFRRNGVACLRGAVDRAWLPRLTQAADQNLANPGRWAFDLKSKESKGRFYNDRMLFRSIPFFREYVFESGVAGLAAQAMAASEIRIFFDQLFVKEPETPEAFLWHQDLPYWPFKAGKICSIWLAITDCSRETSGLEFVRGSHHWSKWYKPVFTKETEGAEGVSWLKDGSGEECPDFSATPEQYDIVSWDMKAGDALIFDALTCHASGGNRSKTQRRVALSTRWLGEDAIWDPRKGTDDAIFKVCDVSQLKPGSPAKDDEVFPVVWRPQN
jgi:ectoine hydroxylase-related dioxygenase (phytanoyl-CoA dioxygenase family)